MSQAESSAAAVKSNGNVALQVAGADSVWRESILVLLVVLAPIGLAVILMAVGLAARTVWQIAHGASVELPAPASIRLYGLLCYALGSWIAVALAWLWSTRREMRRDVFIFRRLTWPALTASIAGFVIAMFGVPIVTHWLTHLTGGRSQEVRFDFHDARSVAIVISCFLWVVTTPVSEEILYRGLLVAWLRRVGWRDFTILILGSLIFAANHITVGLVWSMAMILPGVILFALRLKYDSLSPAWLAHALFNAQLTFNAQLALFYPLIAWFAPAS
jgi:membrane protease YdiL (CAAX protease family)